jgi:hypothetical protein
MRAMPIQVISHGRSANGYELLNTTGEGFVGAVLISSIEVILRGRCGDTGASPSESG